MKNIDRPTLILAFVLAIFLWIYVRVSQEAPTARRVMTRIPVQMVGKVSGIRTSLHPDNITVSIPITGRSETVYGVVADEIKVKVDVSDITSASGAPIPRQTTVTVPETVKLAGKPPIVSIITEQLEQKSFPVSVSFTVLPSVGTQVGQYLLQPADLLVEGTAATMKRVKYVTVSIDPNEPISGGVKIAPRAIDDNGDRVSDANVLQESVLVRLVSGKGTLGTRKVAVRVPEFNKQPRRYLVSVAKIRPDQVTLSGDPALLDLQSAYLKTDPIDVSNISKDTTLTVKLRIPSSLTVAEGATVRVDLEVQPVP